MSISEAKWTFAPFVLASSITSFLLLTFVRFHAEIFSNFSHSLSTAAFAAGIFLAWGKGINLWTKLWCCNELFPFHAIWSSWWFGKDSPIRSLGDSLASTMHENFDLFLFCDWEYKFSIIFEKYYFLCIESFCIDFRYVHRFQLLKFCNQYVTLPNSFPRTERIQGTIQVRLSFQIDGFLPGLSQK